MNDGWNVLTAFGTAAAVLVAIWAVVVAHRANGRAEDSNKIAEDSLKVAREAHELNKKLAPPAWSAAKPLDEDKVAFYNQSGETLIVTSLEVEPDQYANLMRAAERPHRVENGDGFAVEWERRYGLGSPRKLILKWHPEGRENEIESVERSL